MKSNKDLTMTEFHVATNIKRAMLHIETNPDYAKSFLLAALRSLHR